MLLTLKNELIFMVLIQVRLESIGAEDIVDGKLFLIFFC